MPVVPPLRKVLLAHKARTGRRGEDLVFGRTASEPFTPSSVRKAALAAWARHTCGCSLVEDADVCPDHGKGPYKPLGLHEARHTYVSLMIDAGVPIERVGDYVGHTSAYMTEAYRHLLDGHEEDTLDRFGAYLDRRARVLGGRTQ